MTIRSPAIQRANRGLKKASTYSMPAPVGGWNARDPLAAMRETDAVVLDNWYPMAADVQLRKGVESWATGFSDDPKRLLAWNGPSSSKLFAATDSDIFSVTASGAIGASVESCTSPDFRHANFTTAGGSYLIAVNGQDKLKLYDGTTWKQIDATSTPAITGVNTDDLTFVTVAKRRLWFVQASSTSAWYLPTAAIAGAAVEFPLGQVFTKGGHLVSIGNWTIDGGDGQDDYTVFMSSEGEVVVYKGTDPDSATTFAKVGVYYVGEPLDNNCFTSYGGDLLVLCRNGLFPLSRALQSATIDRAKSLMSKIDSAFLQAVSAYGGNPGWSVTVFPEGGFVLVNVPIASGYSDQYVMNSVTGAWCRFTGIYASAWLVWGTRLYFTSSSKVGLAWQGTSDFGAAIPGVAQQAYTYFRQPGRQKHLKILRPMLVTTGPVGTSVGLDVDFSPAATLGVPTSVSFPGFTWDGDTSLFDSAEWAPDTEAFRNWTSAASPPFSSAALRLQVSASTATITWSATDFVYELGGVL